MKKYINKDNFEYLLVLVSLIFIFLCMVVSTLFGQPTHKEIYNELIKQEVLYPKIVLQVAYLETHCGQGGVGKSKNNLFGFRGKEYFYFNTWQESITYYKNWQNKKLNKYYTYKNNTNIDYYDFIWFIGWKDGKRYGEKGKNYIDKLKTVKIYL